MRIAEQAARRKKTVLICADCRCMTVDFSKRGLDPSCRVSSRSHAPVPLPGESDPSHAIIRRFGPAMSKPGPTGAATCAARTDGQARHRVWDDLRRSGGFDGEPHRTGSGNWQERRHTAIEHQPARNTIAGHGFVAKYRCNRRAAFFALFRSLQPPAYPLACACFSDRSLPFRTGGIWYESCSGSKY